MMLRNQRTPLMHLRSACFMTMTFLTGLQLQSQYSISLERDLLVDQPTQEPKMKVNVTMQANQWNRKGDWFDPEIYATASKKCFYVEDMCHSSNRWFYRDNDAKHQPSFNYKMFVRQKAALVQSLGTSSCRQTN
jgi:hypothetical protein